MASNEELVMQIKAGDESKLLELWRAADGGSLRFRRSVSKSTGSGRNTRTPSDYEFCFGWKSNSAMPNWHRYTIYCHRIRKNSGVFMASTGETKYRHFSLVSWTAADGFSVNINEISHREGVFTLRATDEKIIAALLSCSTNRAAAAEVGLSERQLYTRMWRRPPSPHRGE